ncbi:hypothetical protein [Pseudomonas sp.]|uniref:hypothetical protein n=1 Tax=Pseudomonas sp. TaxID=306 RepID=UPI0028AF734A|nr:hypothetical protein [Pseudomonas sp.]
MKQLYIEAKVRDARFWNQIGVMRRKHGDEGADRAFSLAKEAIRLARTNCQ